MDDLITESMLGATVMLFCERNKGINQANFVVQLFIKLILLNF